MKKLGIYIHWPFCKSKCPYCDFNSHVATSELEVGSWLEAYLFQFRNIMSCIDLEDYEVQSIFFGGGTPSLMSDILVGELIKFVSLEFRCAKEMEITLEANPSSIEYGKFADFRRAGVNRVSIGVQSLRQSGLSWLGRTHDVGGARRALRVANDVFENYSFDLIYGRGDQSVESWRDEISEVADIAKNHISVYSLAIEEGTKFFDLVKSNKLDLPSPEVAEQMFFVTQEVLGGLGFVRYEISNYAKNGMESVHNMLYWQSQDYLGIGPGAVGRCFFKNGKRVEVLSVRSPAKWIDQLSSGEWAMEVKEISNEVMRQEVLMMGMRIKDGIDLAQIKHRLHLDVLQECMLPIVENFITLGLLMRIGDRLVPTQEGMNLSNSIVSHIIYGQS
jgi:putative oxygen-independent coproporphyrinogen III oxidase